MDTIIAKISKKTFEKVINNPFSVLYGTVAHIWDGKQDNYVITNQLSLPIKQLNDNQNNDLYERAE